jgi:hypothetical protein
VTLLVPWNGAGDTTVGSLGMNVAPDFNVEFTDPNQRQPPPGYATNSNLCFVQFTASAMGATPSVPTSKAGDAFLGAPASYGYLSEGLAVSRARILGGPVTCSGTN